MAGTLPFLLAHGRTHWRLLALGGVGVLATAFLLATIPLALATAREGSLRFELGPQQRLIEDLDIHLWVPFRPMERRIYERADALVQATAAEHLDWVTRSMASPIPPSIATPTGSSKLVRYANTPEFFLILPQSSGQIEINTPSAVLQFQEGLEEHVRLVEGRWWAPGSPVAEAVMDPEAARLLGLRVGDPLEVIPLPQDPAHRAPLTLVGLVEPLNPREEFWLGYDRFSAVSPGGDAPPVVSLFVHPDAFLDVLGKALAPQQANYWWYAYLRSDILTTGNFAEAAEGVRALENEVGGVFPRATAFTALDLAFSRHEARQLFTSAPLQLLAVLTTGVALLYLLMTGALLVERQRATLALLRSRGVSVARLVLPLGIEVAAMALLSVAAAPLLARLAVGILLVQPLETLSGADLPVAQPLGAAYLVASAGGLAAMAAFLAPAVLGARATGLRLRRETARAPLPPLAFRLYLDLFLLALGGLLAWEFTRSAGGVSRSVLGPPSQNPLFLVAPLLLLVGFALLLLRLLPALYRLLGAFLGPVAPAWASLGLRDLARQPGASLPLVLLLATAAGTAVVAASLAPTLAASLGDGSTTAAIPRSDPVLETSLRVLARLSLALVTLLAGLAVLLVAQAVPQARFVHLGVLQAMGMSQGQVGRWLLLEHALVLVAALGGGLWAGRQIAQWLLPLLDNGVRNRFVLSVSQVSTEWVLVAGFAVVTALVLLVPLHRRARSLGPSALRSGLRLGEEG